MLIVETGNSNMRSCYSNSGSSQLSHQPTVDGDSLFSSVSCCSSSLQSFRTSQVHKVKLCCQCLKLIDLCVISQTVVSFIVLKGKWELSQNKDMQMSRETQVLCQSIYVVISGAHSNLAEVDGEDGVGAWTLYVHLSTGGGARQSTQLQTLDHLLEKRWN